MEGVFGGFGDEGVSVCKLGDMLGDVDVDYAEAVGDCPLDVWKEAVVLLELVLLSLSSEIGRRLTTKALWAYTWLSCGFGWANNSGLSCQHTSEEGARGDIRIMNNHQNLLALMQFRRSKYLVVERAAQFSSLDIKWDHVIFVTENALLGCSN